ncbi:MAG: DUF1488 domain-containing protein [Hyphomicrobiales bacterium]
MSRNMTLSFPNLSRSYDETRNRVRFWGYDTAIEISFFVEAAALRTLVPDLIDGEAELLKAFDDTRERIHEVADAVYARSRKDSYVYILAPEDF